jgi:hypothetical protein
MDGEGSVLLYKRRDVVAMKIVATNTDKPLLDWLSEVTGVGAVTAHRAEGERNRATFMWYCNADAAESVLRQIRPYLRIKAVQADLALETQARLRDPALKADRTWQEEYRQRMKSLNARGPRLGVASL